MLQQSGKPIACVFCRLREERNACFRDNRGVGRYLTTHKGISDLSQRNETIPTSDLKGHIIGLDELSCHRNSIQHGRNALMQDLHQLMHLRSQLQPRMIYRRVHTCGMGGKQDDRCREQMKLSRTSCEISRNGIMSHEPLGSQTEHLQQSHDYACGSRWVIV